MADNEFKGSALYATWVSTYGTIVLNTDFRNFTFSETAETVDATAGADATKRTLSGFKTSSVSCSMLMQTDGGTVPANAFRADVSGTLIWGPAGTVASRVKYTLPARCMGNTQNLVYTDVAQWDVTWESTGDLVVGAY